MAVDSPHAVRLQRLERRAKAFAVIAVVLIIGAAAIGLWAIRRFDTQPGSLAQFGSFLAGSAVGLISLAGLVLIYIAFVGQQMQIVQQQEELQLTRQEMQQQTATFQAERFDATFFSLLDAHATLVAELDDNFGQGPKRGRSLFGDLGTALRAQHSDTRTGVRQPATLDETVRSYLALYKEHESTLGPYFRSLYHIVRFVDEKRLASGQLDDRKRYSNLCRARLSADELVAMFYNLASPKGEGFRALAKQYSLLKHLPTERLVNSGHLDEFLELQDA